MEVAAGGSVNKTHPGKKRCGRIEDVPGDVHSDTGPAYHEEGVYYLGYFHIAGNKSVFTLPAGQDLHVTVLPHSFPAEETRADRVLIFRTLLYQEMCISPTRLSSVFFFFISSGR